MMRGQDIIEPHLLELMQINGKKLGDCNASDLAEIIKTYQLLLRELAGAEAAGSYEQK
jgi:hypothetical protein